MEGGSRIACGLEGLSIFEYVLKSSKVGFLKYMFDLNCCFASVATDCNSTQTITVLKMTEYGLTDFADLKTLIVLREYGLKLEYMIILIYDAVETKISQTIQTLNDYLFTITSKNSLGWHFLTSCCPCVAPCCCISITL